MTKYISTYLAMLTTFLGLDLLWLGWVAKSLYQKQLGHLMREDIQWTAALIFYSLFVVGVFIFAVLPGHEKNSFWHSAILGGLFGFFTYMTFELTGFATLKSWPLQIVFVDIIWGIVLSSIVSLVGFWTLQAFR